MDHRYAYDCAIALRCDLPLVLAHGEFCFCDECAGPWPGPVDTVAMRSEAYRLERGRAIARWLKVPEDAVEETARRHAVLMRQDVTRMTDSHEAEAERIERSRRERYRDRQGTWREAA